MAYPPVGPTGAMASGDYVDYMIQYNNGYADYILDELNDYVTTSTVYEWGSMWNRILKDTSKQVTTLEAAVAKLKSQAYMAKDAISKL